MKLIVVSGSEIDKSPLLSVRLLKERQAGNLVVLLSNYCRAKTVELYYRHANMFVADHGMFAFSGCHCLYHQPLSSKELEDLKNVLGNTNCAVYDEVENACGGALRLYEKGKWKERPYLLMAEKPDDDIYRKLSKKFDLLDVGDDRLAMFPKWSNYEAGIEACAKEAGIGKDDIILW